VILIILILLVLNSSNIFAEEANLNDILEKMDEWQLRWEQKMIEKSNEIIIDAKRLAISLALMITAGIGTCLLFSKIKL